MRIPPLNQRRLIKGERCKPVIRSSIHSDEKRRPVLFLWNTSCRHPGFSQRCCYERSAPFDTNTVIPRPWESAPALSAKGPSKDAHRKPCQSTRPALRWVNTIGPGESAARRVGFAMIPGADHISQWSTVSLTADRRQGRSRHYQDNMKELARSFQLPTLVLASIHFE